MERIDELWELAGNGLSRQDAARVTGISLHVIYERLPKEAWLELRATWQALTHHRPACFSEKDWREWNLWAQFAQPNRYGFCEDCTPQFADEMRSQGKCERPYIAFVLTEDGFSITTRGEHGQHAK